MKERLIGAVMRCRANQFLLLSLVCSMTYADIIRVPMDQATIQDGINASRNGDTVLVFEGTYYENISFEGRAISLVGRSGAENTTIDGSMASQGPGGQQSVVFFSNGEGPSSVIRGFTIRGGGGTFIDGFGHSGGGILCIEGAHPTIVDNIITGNNTDINFGGGICCLNESSPLIAHNTISMNVAIIQGGGICCMYDSRPIIDGNIIIDNSLTTGWSYGGGIACAPGSASVITNNLIAGNSSNSDGGGIYIRTSINTGIISNNLILNNSSFAGGGIFCESNFREVNISNCTIAGNSAVEGGGIRYSFNAFSSIENTILWGNTAPTGKEIYVGDDIGASLASINYTCIEGGEESVYIDASTVIWGEGILKSDPLFNQGPEGSHYLSQVAAGQKYDSPCVDGGDPDSISVIGTTRSDEELDSGIVDIGYHYSVYDQPRIVTAPGPGYGNQPRIRVFTPQSDPALDYEFDAYGCEHYGANVTGAYLEQGPRWQIITGPGPGNIYGPHVRGYEIDGTPLPGLSFLAYGTNKYGVNVAAGDIDADGFDEIITGAGPGAVFGPHVRAWNYDGSSVSPLAGVSYFAYGTPKWGVNVSAGDIDGDGYDEIITGAGPGAVYGPHVRGWDVDGGGVSAIPHVSFFAYGTLKYGVNVCAGDVDGDGIDEIITGPGPGVIFGPHVRGWNLDGASLSPLAGYSFFAFDQSYAKYGVNVYAGVDLDRDGRSDLVAGTGPDPNTSAMVKVFIYNGDIVTEWISFQAYDDQSKYGVNISAVMY